MSIKYKCPQCRAKLENPDSMGGLQDTCPACRTFLGLIENIQIGIMFYIIQVFHPRIENYIQR